MIYALCMRTKCIFQTFLVHLWGKISPSFPALFSILRVVRILKALAGKYFEYFAMIAGNQLRT